MNYFKKLINTTLLLPLIVACTDSTDTGGSTYANIPSHTFSQLTLGLDLTGDNVSYAWSMESAPDQKYTLTNKTSEVVNLIATTSGTYELLLTVNNNGEVTKSTLVVNVTPTQSQLSQYISKIYDFAPAVGQFTNEMPEYEDGDSKEDIRLKAEEYIVGKDGYGPISLGGFGGYVVFGFDHTVRNVIGERDIRINGNSFYAGDATQPGGSCEPGVILVSYDANKNGKADDEWYEIAGSEHSNKNTIKNYEITYFRPESDNTDPSKYIRWEDNQGGSGYKSKNLYNRQSYYPKWIKEDKITFKGTLLPNNGENQSEDDTYEYWILNLYGYGYADNDLNSADNSAFDISWAVNSKGEAADLAGVDFVKVHTSINQECGSIGEISTEIQGAYDLHLTQEVIESRVL